MDKYDYQQEINDLLDNALNELSNDDFEILLSKVDDIINEYE